VVGHDSIGRRNVATGNDFQQSGPAQAAQTTAGKVLAVQVEIFAYWCKHTDQLEILRSALF
jgi:hypothetical protein